MRPLADFLVRVCSQIHPVLYIAHISNRNRLHIIGLAELDHLPTGFV
jgi:hypothetical protein